MKSLDLQLRFSQRGVATLITSLMVLFVMTLITFYATQSSVMETNVSANQYRSDQAYAAASGAMDFAEGRFSSAGGVDGNGDGTADCTAASPCNFNIANPAGTQTLSARYFFCDPDQLDPAGTGALLSAAQVMANPSPCTNTTAAGILGTGRYADQVGIVAIGFSDDKNATRVLIKASAVSEPIADGPGSPLSNGGAVGITGNMTIINRFQDFTVWSGKDVGTSGSADTYIAGPALDNGICMSNYRAANDDDANTVYNATLHATCTSSTLTNPQYSIKATDKDRTASYDVVDNDPNLTNLIGSPDPMLTLGVMYSPDKFWNNFFNISKSDFLEKAAEANQLNTALTTHEFGYIWHDGNMTSNQVADIGDLANRKSALLVVTGNLTINGGTIYGVVYVMGDLNAAGNFVVQGALIVRGRSSGNGGPMIIYDPNAFDDSSGPVNGAVVGSWRDW